MRQCLLQGKSFSLLIFLSLVGGYVLQNSIQALNEDLPLCIQLTETFYNYQHLPYAAPQCIEWKAPVPQDKEGFWLYGLCHRPCFSYDAQGLIFQAYPIYSRQDSSKASTFRLLQLEQLYYPIMFEGYYQAAPEADYTFLLYDGDKKQSFRLGLVENTLLWKPDILFSGQERINEEPECTERVHEDSEFVFDEPREQNRWFPDKSNTEQQLKCIAFQSQEWDSERQCLQEAFLELWDTSLQKSFVLPLQKKLLLDSYRMTLVQSEKTCIQFGQVGDSVQLSEGTLSLKGVYPQYNTILLEYQDVQRPYPDYFYLSL